MCKLLIMTGITEPVLAEIFMQNMAIPMSQRDNHGIGYAAINSKGELFAERWLYNFMFMDYEQIMIPSIAKKLKKYEFRLPEGSLDTNYNSVGNKDLEDVRSVIMHTRFATQGNKTIENTHPFIYDDTALVHNGTIKNAFSTTTSKGLDLNKVSTCDSEAALQTYLLNKVGGDFTKGKDWLDSLDGGYAFGVLGKDEKGNRILDVVRGTSWLYKMKIEGLGTVFTTDKDHAIAVLKHMGMEFQEQPSLLVWDSMYRFDALTGEQLNYECYKTATVTTTTTTYYGGGRNYTSNHYGGNGSSSSSRGSKSTRPEDHLLGAEVYDLDDEQLLMTFDDFKKDNGSWEYSKVSRFCNDREECMLDRLELWDAAYGTNLLNKYEFLLTDDEKASIFTQDWFYGWKSAKKLLFKTIKKAENSTKENVS